MSPGGFPVNRPGTGGMMPGAPGFRKIPGSPLMDNDKWEYPKSRSMPKGVDPNARSQAPLMRKPTPLNSRLLPQGSGGFIGVKNSALLQGSGQGYGQPTCQPSFGSGLDPIGQPTRQPSFGSSRDPLDQIPQGRLTPPQPAPVDRPTSGLTAGNINLKELKRKTTSLLEEYFSVRLLDEALQCVVELKSPSYHSEIVRDAINLGLEKNPPCVDPVSKLFEYLFTKNIFSAQDISNGCLLYAEMMDDIAIDLPKAPNNFGEILGKLISVGVLNFRVVKEILEKIEDEIFRKPVFDNIVKSVGNGILEAQSVDVEACKAFL